MKELFYICFWWSSNSSGITLPRWCREFEKNNFQMYQDRLKEPYVFSSLVTGFRFFSSSDVQLWQQRTYNSSSKTIQVWDPWEQKVCRSLSSLINDIFEQKNQKDRKIRKKIWMRLSQFESHALKCLIGALLLPCRNVFWFGSCRSPS